MTQLPPNQTKKSLNLYGTPIHEILLITWHVLGITGQFGAQFVGGRWCSLFLTMQCFPFFNNAIFEQFINLDVFDNVLKNQNIVLTMHISDVFGNDLKQIDICTKSF